MAFLPPIFAGGSFAATRDFVVNFGGNPDRGLLVLAYSEGSATVGGTPIVSCVIDPAGINLALAAGLERLSAPVIGYSGRLRAFWIAGPSVPTGVRLVRVTAADGAGKLQIWALPFDGFSVVSGETLSDGQPLTPSITVPSAPGRVVVAMAHSFALPDSGVITPNAPATMLRRVQLSDNPVLVGAIWQEAGAASTVVDGSWTGPTAAWGVVGWSLTPGTGGGAAPSITSGPSSVSVPAGSSASFTVSATGDGLSYQWFRNGTLIPGAIAPSYTLAVVAGDNGAEFRVVVTGSTLPAVTSGIATLTVTVGAVYGFVFPDGVYADFSGAAKLLSAPWVGYAIPWDASNPVAAATATRTPVSGTTASDGAIAVTGLPAPGLYNVRLFAAGGAYTIIETAA